MLNVGNRVGVEKKNEEGGRGVRGKGKRGTYGNANLGRMATPKRSSAVSAAQRRRVSDRRPRQWQANGAVILNEKYGHTQTGLFDVSTPVGLVRWGPDLLWDNGVGGRDKIQEPQWVIQVVVGQDVVTGVADGRTLDHQGVGPSGHVLDETDVPRVHLEEGLDEKRCVPLSEHPHEEPVAADEGDRCVHLVLVATRRGGVSRGVTLIGVHSSEDGGGRTMYMYLRPFF